MKAIFFSLNLGQAGPLYVFAQDPMTVFVVWNALDPDLRGEIAKASHNGEVPFTVQLDITRQFNLGQCFLPQTVCKFGLLDDDASAAPMTLSAVVPFER